MLPLAHFTGFFAGLFLLVAAKEWWQVVKAVGDPPTISASRLRNAGISTVMAFGMLGITLIIVFIDHVA